MEGRRALIALKGVLFLLGYCEQMDFIPTRPNRRWHLFFMLDDFKATRMMQTKAFLNDLTKIKSRETLRYPGFAHDSL